MKFLIFGGNGLVGKSLQALLKSKGEEFFATYRSNGSDNKLICDISKLNDLEAAFQTSQPDIVINATNLAGGVNKCEFESELAYNFHFTSNKHMADLANKYNVRSVPTVIVEEGGKEVDRIIGSVSKQQVLQKLL